MKRTAQLLTIAAIVMSLAQPARADSMMTSATRDANGSHTFGTGADTSAVQGIWKFTVVAESGRFSQVLVSIRTAAGEAVAFASNAQPRVGDVFTSFDPVPPGAYQLRSRLWGGNGEASITIAVDTP